MKRESRLVTMLAKITRNKGASMTFGLVFLALVTLSTIAAYYGVMMLFFMVGDKLDIPTLRMAVILMGQFVLLLMGISSITRKVIMMDKQVH